MVSPPQPDIFRSWLARGTFSPSPWARSMAEWGKETRVTFSRTAVTKDLSGGFKGGAPADYLTADCHVEIEADFGLLISEPSVGPVRRRHYVIMLDFEDIPDASKIPQPGDFITFTDALGIRRQMTIETSDAPEGIADHVEIMSSDFD